MIEQGSSTPVPENTSEVPVTWKRNMSPSQLANLRRAPDDGEFPVSVGGKISEEMDAWIRSLPDSRSYTVRKALTLYRMLKTTDNENYREILLSIDSNPEAQA